MKIASYMFCGAGKFIEVTQLVSREYLGVAGWSQIPMNDNPLLSISLKHDFDAHDHCMVATNTESTSFLCTISNVINTLILCLKFNRYKII
jgi:hypothetical protein